jgi:hypothetical protein
VRSRRLSAIGGSDGAETRGGIGWLLFAGCPLPVALCRLLFAGCPLLIACGPLLFALHPSPRATSNQPQATSNRQLAIGHGQSATSKQLQTKGNWPQATGNQHSSSRRSFAAPPECASAASRILHTRRRTFRANGIRLTRVTAFRCHASRARGWVCRIQEAPRL